MIWLLSQLWPIALISLLAGFVVTWVTVVQRRTVTARRRVQPVSRETVAAGPVTSVGSSFEARTDAPQTDVPRLEYPDGPYVPREDREPYVDHLEESALHEVDDDLGEDDDEYLDDEYDDDRAAADDDFDEDFYEEPADGYSDDSEDDFDDELAGDDFDDDLYAPDDEYPSESARRGSTPAPKGTHGPNGIGSIGTSVTSRLKGLRRR